MAILKLSELNIDYKSIDSASSEWLNQLKSEEWEAIIDGFITDDEIEILYQMLFN